MPSHPARSRWLVPCLALTVIILATSCSAKAGKQDVTGPDGVAMGPGVSAEEIALGSLSDLTGPFAANDTKITNAMQVHVEELNAAGGVCGRRVTLRVADHGYDVQKATTAYSQLVDEVLGMPQVFGGSVNAALLGRYAADDLVVWPGSGAGNLLGSRNVLPVGATYDYEMINLIDYWVRKGILASGQTVAHVALRGDYGETALAGSRFAAGRAGMTLLELPIQPTDTDLTAQVAAAKQAGAAAVLISASPKQTASVAAAAATAGLEVPLGSDGPGWSGDLLNGPAAPTLLDRLYVSQSWASPGMDLPAVSDFVARYGRNYPGAEIDSSVLLGKAVATVYTEVLRRACANKDLTRAGVHKAVSELGGVETGGLMPPLVYARPGASPTTSTLLLRPADDVAGGLRTGEPQPLLTADVSGYRPTY